MLNSDSSSNVLSSNLQLRCAASFTALMTAACLGLPELVDQLLGTGADVNEVVPLMWASVLHRAALSGNPHIVRLLIDRGTFIDQQSPILGNTALIDAVLYRSEEAVQLLLRRGARTEIRNHWQQTALELAEAEGLEKIAGLDRKSTRLNSSH